MIEEKVVFKTEVDVVLETRSDLTHYLLGLGRMYGGRPAIKIDKSLARALEAFGIPIPEKGDNLRIMRMLKKDGVFEGVKDYTHSDLTFVATLFHTLEGFYQFIENFSDWLMKNDTKSRPTVKEIGNQD